MELGLLRQWNAVSPSVKRWRGGIFEFKAGFFLDVPDSKVGCINATAGIHSNEKDAIERFT
ncbi:hypothetical protein J15TS10_25350 [Paenibacillus woosongensis]|uniref:Uncharacterized protein n=1 Tax=Paenibacillus woosongensis TaxID=307580 RepID=A0ABQ4MRY7_9BACL|nr:hypothetical protein J15TS10_25350 [Paenibacillus woosongensis]